MKNFKRIASVVMVLMMMLSMMLPAMAETTITIKPNISSGTTDGSETYSAYKIFKAVFSDEVIGENTNVAYTIESNSKFYDLISTAADENGKKYFTLDQLNDSITYIVGLNKDASDPENVVYYYNEKEAAKLAVELNKVADKEAEAVTVTKAFADGKYTLTLNGDDGYYLITSSVGTALILDTLASSEINTKNTYPTINKQIFDNDLDIPAYVENDTTTDNGNDATFKLIVNIPATASGEIVVHDDMEYLAYSELKSFTNQDNYNEGVTVKEVQKCSDETYTTTAQDNEFDCNVEFTLSAEYVAAHVGTSIEIEYTAKMIGDNNNANNKAINTVYLTDNGYTSIEDSVEVYNTDIPVYKYTNTDSGKSALAGAGFVLKNENGEYYKYENDTVSWVKNIDESDTMVYKTTNENNGMVTFTGLADGTYTLVEHIVPVGYNAVDDITVVVDNGEVKVNNIVVPQVEVLNQSGTELPSTGGIGTTIFYCAGAILAVGAFVLLITKKRMGKEV